MRILFAGLGLAVLACAASVADAQPTKPAASTKPYRSPHNVFGQPDFDGTWSLNSLTKLERPRTIPNLVLTPEQLKTPAPQILPNDAVGTADSDPLDGFRSEWSELNGEYRSSWLIFPADGRLPYSEAGNRLYATRGNNDNPEGRSNYERCIYMPQGGPPMFNAAYNNHITFVQTRDTIAFLLEANHEVRTIRLNTRTHGPNRQWFGDSVGWWEGETLVVETVGFPKSQTDRRGATTRLVMSPNAKVMERFTRISDRQIKYEFSVDDPDVFTSIWKGEMPFTTTTEKTYEYACHEGNYGLANILSGARYEEEERAKAATVR